MTDAGDQRDVFEAFLAVGETFVTLDAMQPGVDVPEHLRSTTLTLKFSPRYKPHDLDVTTVAVSQTLSFKGRFYTVTVPWAAVTRIAVTGDGSTYVAEWPEPPPAPVLTKRRGFLGVVQ